MELSEKSHMLVRQFKKDMIQKGSSTVICPVCGQKPQISNTPKGERTTIACKCGYIYDSEFNL